MKRTLHLLLVTSVLCLFPFFASSQTSTMEFQSGTTIEVTSGADICADNVIINGTYSGTGTQCGGALPVELVVMTAQAAKTAVTLNWTTATETNNYGFEVEKADAQSGKNAATNQWRKIGFVEGAGTSNSPRHYSFTDKNLEGGVTSYRLKQIDRDGKTEYSKSVQVEIPIPRILNLSQNYPNPFNPSTTFEFTLPEDGKASLKILDVLGREVTTLFEGNGKTGYILQSTFDASSVATGTYFARLQFGDKQLVRKILLLK